MGLAIIGTMRKCDSTDSTFFRSGDRVFSQNGKWFFQTREDDHGPFPTREAAEVSLQRYVDEMAFFDAAAGMQTDSAPTDRPDPNDPDFANFSLVEKD